MDLIFESVLNFLRLFVDYIQSHVTKRGVIYNIMNMHDKIVNFVYRDCTLSRPIAVRLMISQKKRENRLC